jgi:GntR family transcriptional regulator/MocR family aminotransferase
MPSPQKERPLGAHIRRMRKLHAARRQCLLEAIRGRFGDTLPVSGGKAGLHLVLHLPERCDDVALTGAALVAGISVRPLSRCHAEPRRAPRGLLQCHACVKEAGIGPAFATLAQVPERALGTRPAPLAAP